MTRLVPDSLYGRALVLLVVGLLVSHMFSMAIHYGDPAHRTSLFAGEDTVGHMAAAIRALRHADPELRGRLAKNLNADDLALSLDEIPEAADRADWRVDIVAHGLAHDLPDMPLQISVRHDAFCGSVMPRPIHASPCAPNGDTLIVVAKLSNGPVALASPISGLDPGLLSRMGLELLIMGAGILILSLWAAHILTRPLGAFARAAEGLGRDIRAPLIDRGGPREIRQAADAFNQMQGRLRRFIDDRTQMLAAISHDLRSPITRLRLRAEFVEDAAERAKMLSDLDDMEQMTDLALAFARDEANTERAQKVDLAALIESICHDFQDAGAQTACAGEVSRPVQGRPVTLKRGFRNLIDNAIKYGHAARVRIAEHDHDVVVEIDDDGPGIPEDMLEQAFQPFFRLDSARTPAPGGSGLGLAVARTAFRGHGGEVTLANRHGGGLRATITLPI